MTENKKQKELHPVLEFIISSRFAGLCGILGPLIALFGIISAIAISPWFNWFTSALSDLGHPTMIGGSNGVPGLNPAASIFNTSLILAGLFTIVLTLWLIRHQLFEASVIGIVAGILLTIAQCFLIAIGVFHEGLGFTHFVVSLGFFVTLLLAGMIYGVRLMQEKHLRLIGITAFILALVSALIWIAYYLSFLPFAGVAIPEIISAITAIIWVYPLCIMLLMQKQM
ncbi:MAG: DUF998 domain-containing protein [Candidatus Thorarchaeota archaeon]